MATSKAVHDEFGPDLTFGSEDILPAFIEKDRSNISLEVPESNEEKAERQMDKLPQPRGWRLLIVPYSQPQRSKGGIEFSQKTIRDEELATVIGKVISMGPMAYADPIKFADEPWCEIGDYVIFGRYTGSRVKLFGGKADGSDDLNCRLMNDDEILAVVNDPSDYVGLS